VAKTRYMAIPPGTTVGYEPDIAWEFPVGAILMKEFILQADERDPESQQVLETRFLVKYDERFWRGYSYRWNDEGTDATLMPNVIDDVILQYEVTEEGGTTRMHDHVFPGRTTCLQCHAPRANGANGVQTAQMNLDFDYGDVTDNQLRTLEHIGFFTEPLPATPDELPRMVDPQDETASLELRARSYLHANCAHCHRRRGSATTSTLYIPYEWDISDTNACIGRDEPGVAGAMCASFDVRVIPGSAETSLLTCLMTSGEMPPVGTYQPDPARQVVYDWIDSLESCP
jgi:cytochrome c553